MTIQKNQYGEPVQWSAELPGTKDYLRTPKSYGYYTLSYTPKGGFKASLSGVYTGTMLVAHYGLAGDVGTVENDILFSSPQFFEMNVKLSYTFEIKRLDSSLEFFGGMGNIFNNYQNDFDSGKNRDSGYVFGPSKPRTIFFGLKIFN
jgi:outer membrane receptor for ferrienterochelin and colicins